MIISSLEITHFRNLRGLSLQCSNGLNLIVGENASGKTSFLEAIYFLGRAKSFRTRQVRELIQHDAAALRVFASLHSSTTQRNTPIGIERNSRELIARVNRQPVHSLAELATWVPVLLLNPDSHRLLEDGPQQRRRFIDWGLFHQEPQFLSHWRRYRTALQHRNAALRSRSDPRNMSIWEQELVVAALAIDRLRQSFCQALEATLQPLFREILDEKNSLQLEYRRGWSQERDLLDLLQQERAQDQLNGHTRAGPHRADFVIRLSGRPFSEQLSRGQQKLLVIALVLAQVKLYQQHKGESCLLLCDDLPAELDQTNRNKVMSCLADQNLQLFITAIDSDALLTSRWRDSAKRVFKLTHGQLNEMV